MAKNMVIVKGTQNEHAGKFFMMDPADLSWRKEFELVATGYPNRKDSKVMDNGCKAFAFVCHNGKVFRVFGDYSAREE